MGRNALTERIVNKIQPLSIEKLFVQACTQVLMRNEVLYWDDERALFWVDTSAGLTVAVWMMPIALKFEPNKTLDKQRQ